VPGTPGRATAYIRNERGREADMAKKSKKSKKGKKGKK
jgi:hypothetical protein